ncbi:hypothetical protein C1N73_29125 (plasmid) [Priestia aryabhattai]
MAKIIKFRKQSRISKKIHTLLLSYNIRLILLIFGGAALLLFVYEGFHINLVTKYFFTAFWIYVFYAMVEIIRDSNNS